MRWKTLNEAKLGNLLPQSVVVARIISNDRGEVLTNLAIDSFYANRVTYLREEEEKSDGRTIIRWLPLPELKLDTTDAS